MHLLQRGKRNRIYRSREGSLPPIKQPPALRVQLPPHTQSVADVRSRAELMPPPYDRMLTSPQEQEHQHARLPSSGDVRRYKGVRRRKWGRWVAEIRLPNSRDRIWLGSYDTPEKAARAFDAAFVCLSGPGAADGLNFPSSPPAVARTSDVDEVYAVAVSYGNNHDTAMVAREEAAVDPPPPRDSMLPADNNVAAAAVPPRQLQVSTERLDCWSEFVNNPPPLYSPTWTGSHEHLLPVPVTADVHTDETESGAFLSLWSFDSSGGSCSWR